MAAFLVALVIVAVQIISSNCLPEEKLNTAELIKYHSYPVETHHVETKDGYQLTMHRIPRGRNQSEEEGNKPRSVVYLLHTILSSSADWVMNLPETSLAFVLADKGFDVWLGNLRGNSYSRKHKTIDPKDEKFWDFSLNEHVQYDFPASVEYILKNASREQMYFIGHSYGSMVAFAAVSEDPSLKAKIKIFFALAPITKMAHISAIVRGIAAMSGKTAWVMKMLGIHEFFPSLKSSRGFITTLCRWVPKFCEFGISILGGKDHKFLDKKRIPVYVAHTPAGTSLKSAIHMWQLINAKNFGKYDYGESGNQKHYKMKSAPQYDIKQMSLPTVLVSGTEDDMAPPKDVDNTENSLPFVIKHFRITGYSHMDFVWGKDSGSRLYEKLQLNMSA